MDTNLQMMTEEEYAEPLEAMLLRGEQELFPKLRSHMEKFIAIFNSPKIQAKMQKFFVELSEKVRTIENARHRSVFEMLQSIRNFLDLFRDGFSPIKLLERLQQTGYFALVNDKRFQFLEETIEIDDGAEKLLELVKELTRPESSECINHAFEEYMKSWSENLQRFKISDSDEADAIKWMRHEKSEADRINNSEMQIVIDDLKQHFEPLRKKLLPVDDTWRAINGVPIFGGLFGKASTWTAGHASNGMKKMEGFPLFGDQCAAASRHIFRTAEWYDKTSNFIINYLLNKQSDVELYTFLNGDNQLEKDREHFSECIGAWLKLSWLKEIKDPSQNGQERKLLIPKEIAMAELERAAKFLYAVVLNKPSLLEEHNKLVDDLLSISANATDGNDVSYLPFVSFGQLPLPDENRSRIIHVTLVLPASTSTTNAIDTLSEVKKVFESVVKGTVEERGTIKLLQLDIRFNENVAMLFARNVKRLSDLSIRQVLIGSFGLGGFRNAMNPAYNRIYSKNFEAKAKYFTAISFSSPLIYGGEPYYCPNGWRRYSIDVGKTEKQFQAAYGRWPVAYHGTKGHLAISILLGGLAASGTGEYIEKSEGAIYLSPSIEYCAHPRYAEVWKVKDKYVQLVLQLRVDRRFIYDKQAGHKVSKVAGTLPGAYDYQDPLDPNFKNNNLEWVIKLPPGTRLQALDGILVYGLMLRITDDHPGKLPQNKWWEATKGDPYNEWDFC